MILVELGIILTVNDYSCQNFSIIYNDTMKPQEFIPKFDLFLASKKLSFEGIIVGATALNLIGTITRETVDCDVLDPIIPEKILLASQEFATLEKIPENTLRESWLNNGPASLMRDLPHGWRARLIEVYRGKCLILHTLGRSDLLKSKLFALCDRGTDLKDCIAMNPSLSEMKDCYSWVCERDTNPDWPDHVSANFKKLAGKLGYEF